MGQVGISKIYSSLIALGLRLAENCYKSGDHMVLSQRGEWRKGHGRLFRSSDKMD